MVHGRVADEARRKLNRLTQKRRRYKDGWGFVAFAEWLTGACEGDPLDVTPPPVRDMSPLGRGLEEDEQYNTWLSGVIEEADLGSGLFLIFLTSIALVNHCLHTRLWRFEQMRPEELLA